VKWYLDLGRGQQLLVDELVALVRAGDPDQIRINYGLNKS
jgi:hypothetical protein